MTPYSPLLDRWTYCSLTKGSPLCNTCERNPGEVHCHLLHHFIDYEYSFLIKRGCSRVHTTGGVLVNVQEWGCFSIFRRADDVTRTMSKGGVCACECLHPPFRKSCNRAWTPPFKNPGSAPDLMVIYAGIYRYVISQVATQVAAHQ